MLFKNIITSKFINQDFIGEIIKIEYSVNNKIIGNEVFLRSQNSLFEKSQILPKLCTELLVQIINEKISNKPIDVIAEYKILSDKVDKLYNNQTSNLSNSMYLNTTINDKYLLIKDLILENERLNEELARRASTVQMLNTRIDEMNTTINILSDKIISMKEIAKKLYD